MPSTIVALLVLTLTMISIIIVIFLTIKTIVKIKKIKNKKIEYPEKDIDDDELTPWKIPLLNFKYNHEPFRDEELSFLGRNKISRELVAILEDGRGKSGTYLIAGYRGSGKTSFVRVAIKQYEYGTKRLPSRIKNILPNWLSKYLPKKLKTLRKLHLDIHKINIHRYKDSPRRAIIENSIITNIQKPFQTFAKSKTLTFLGIVTLLLYITPYINESLITTTIFITILILSLILTNFIHIGIRRTLSFKHSFNRFFHPVVRVNLNLGHESLDTKTLLFNMASMLKSKYKKNRNPKRLIIINIIVCSVITTLSSGHIANYIEQHIHKSIFTIYHLPGKNLEDETRTLTFSTQKSAEKYINLLEGENKERWVEYYNQSEEYKTDENYTKICKLIMKNYTINKNKESQIYDSQSPIAKNATHLQRAYCAADLTINKIHSLLLYKNALIKKHGYKCQHHPQEEICSAKPNYFIEYPQRWLHQITFNKLIFTSHKKTHPHLADIISFLSIFSIFYFLLRKLQKIIGRGAVLEKLEELHDRIIYSKTMERGIDSKSLGFFSRKIKKNEPLDSRQTEELLVDALEKNRNITSILPRADIIFIFDELDKINPQTGGEEVQSQTQRTRQRKEEISQLLGNLKNFITIATARFIFIGGRDMYDVNLAEQVAGDNLQSSLFDNILYIPSFLTDDSDGSGHDISSMVEQYVCRNLMTYNIARAAFDIIQEQEQEQEQEISYVIWTLKTYKVYLEYLYGKNTIEVAELYNFLGDFIYYLTYRSAGEAQRLGFHFEHFVEPKEEITNTKNITIFSPKYFPSQYYLDFNEKRQYQIQLIAHIFIILHGEASPLVRHFGDKLTLATFSILDYLFKHHDSAFNIQDIERAPDMLDIHRAPTLPQLVDLLLNRVLKPYLKPIKNGVFEYRFLHFFQKEIAYISQFSETEMAAFNFTLDESLRTKNHFHNLFQQALQHSSQNTQLTSGNTNNFLQNEIQISLPFIHQILGNLYLMDKQFPESSLEFRLALQHVTQAIDDFEQNIRVQSEKALKGQRNPYTLKSYTFLIIAYIHILLKMILISETRRQYDYAIPFCFQAQRTVDHFMETHIGERLFLPNIKILRILLQPYYCLAFIHVKTNSKAKTSVNIITHRIKKIKKTFLDRNKKTCKRKFILTKKEKHGLISEAYTRRAEVNLARSDFKKAQKSYLKALTTLHHSEKNRFKKNKKRTTKPYYISKIIKTIIENNQSNTESTAFIISGIADTIASGKPNNPKEFIKEYRRSAKIYENIGKHSDAALSYWKALFILSYTYKTEEIEKIDNREEILELFMKIEKLQTTSFEYSYKRREQTFDKNFPEQSLTKWLAPPLTQNAIVLISYLHDIKKFKIKEHSQKIPKITELKIRDMGGFPIEARILAYHLKAKRWAAKENFTDAIKLYRKALQEADLYVGGQKLAFPHLGLMFHEMHVLLKKAGSRTIHQVECNDVRYRNQWSSLIDPEYCKSRAEELNKEMVMRHSTIQSKEKEKFFARKHYLYDDFSDPYTNTLWVADYILHKKFL